MAGGMAATAQSLADLAHRQMQFRQQPIQHAGLPHAGVPGKGIQLSGDGGAKRRQSLPCLGADTQHRQGGMTIDVIQLVRRVQIALVQTQQHLTALQGGDGGNAVNEIRLRHRDGGGGQDDQLIDIGGGGTGKHIAARLHSLHKALAPAQVADLDPVAHQRAHALPAELSAGAALQHLGSGIYIVETTEGLLDAPPAQKRIS